MDIVKTWLLVAAERREFDGIRKRLGKTIEKRGLGARFVCEGIRNEDRWVMIANGPGRELVGAALSDDVMREAQREGVSAMISTGYCGALDPKLRVGDIVVSDDTQLVTFERACARGNVDRVCARGLVITRDRVAVTAAEKRLLREQTGAMAVDMESSAVKDRAEALGIPYGCIRVVSDTAEEDMPLDFNRYRAADGRFSRGRIALAAMARPFSVMPALLEFDRQCQRASIALGEALGEALGDFLADCRF
jgi:adenosylhomocysteine nucleosidase